LGLSRTSRRRLGRRRACDASGRPVQRGLGTTGRQRASRARREIGASANDRCSQVLPGRQSRVGQHV